MPKKPALTVNPGKAAVIADGDLCYASYAIRTEVITAGSSLDELAARYLKPLVRPGDVVFVCEKAVACLQSRAYPIASIRAGLLARLLSRFVTRSPYGIGLALPETMQCAIDECGALRILLAALVGAIGRLLGRRGWFYRIAGSRAAAIDGPTPNTLPPYNACVVLAPKEPDRVAARLSALVGGNTVLIVDLNDLGGKILGSSGPVDRPLYLRLLRQNPLGQSREQTPFGLLRPLRPLPEPPRC